MIARFFLVKIFFCSCCCLIALPFSHDSGNYKRREELGEHHEEEVDERRAQTYAHDISHIKRVDQSATLEAEEEPYGQGEDPQVEAGVLDLVAHLSPSTTTTVLSVRLGKNCRRLLSLLLLI